MYSLRYQKSVSTHHIDIYNFYNNEKFCVMLSKKTFLPIEFIVYHDRKQYGFAHLTLDDADISYDIFNCVYEMLDVLNLEEYNTVRIWASDTMFHDFLKKKEYSKKNKE